MILILFNFMIFDVFFMIMGIMFCRIFIVMKSILKIIKLDGVDIVYLFDEVGYLVGFLV